MQKTFLIIGSAAAGIAVMLGAFGAHALKEKLAAGELQVFETGVRYQFYHSIALIVVAILSDKINIPLLNYSGYLFILGIILFSGSLYLLSTKSILGIEGWKFLGPVTPLGGLCFIGGWVLMLISLLKSQS